MTTLAAVAANFTRDLEDNYRVIADHVERARAAVSYTHLTLPTM